MVLDSTDANSVVLVAEALEMVQPADMNLFVVTERRIANMSHPKKGVKMEIKFKRKITSEMMTTYLPSVLLMMITYATTFFKPFFFEAALSVNLTTMLVMTTIFISKMEGLPPTSDIKMIDIWLVLCQMVPFVEVVLLTAMEYHREDKHEDEIMQLNAELQEVEEELEEEGESEEEVGKRCWIPQLKTLGDLKEIYYINVFFQRKESYLSWCWQVSWRTL